MRVERPGDNQKGEFLGGTRAGKKGGPQELSTSIVYRGQGGRRLVPIDPHRVKGKQI